MLTNPEEKINALTKLADLIGKKTLVMWCIVTTFTTSYLYVQNGELQEKLYTTQGDGYERLLNEMKSMRKDVSSATSQLDTTIHNVKSTLNKINNKE